MKKLLGVVLALGLILYAIYRWQGGAAGLVGAALPAFPDFPAPAASLADGPGAGVLYFASGTPFDLDVLLAGDAGELPTTGTGTLFLPEAASAEAPVPAMVVLHGSGGITPGREMEYGELLARATPPSCSTTTRPGA